MIKETIKIRGKYTGEDKKHLKKGDPMCIDINKKYLIHSYMIDAVRRDMYNIESILLITYVRERVNRIFLTDSFYL